MAKQNAKRGRRTKAENLAAIRESGVPAVVVAALENAKASEVEAFLKSQSGTATTATERKVQKVAMPDGAVQVSESRCIARVKDRDSDGHLVAYIPLPAKACGVDNEGQPKNRTRYAGGRQIPRALYDAITQHADAIGGMYDAS